MDQYPGQPYDRPQYGGQPNSEQPYNPYGTPNQQGYAPTGQTYANVPPGYGQPQFTSSGV